MSPDHASPTAVRVDRGSLKLLEFLSVSQPDSGREVDHESLDGGVGLLRRAELD